MQKFQNSLHENKDTVASPTAWGGGSNEQKNVFADHYEHWREWLQVVGNNLEQFTVDNSPANGSLKLNQF